MKFKGIMPALVTPLDETERINIDTLNRLMNDLNEQGADGFYIGGASGEGLAIRPEERKILTEIATENCKKYKLPAIIQIASTDFNTAVMLAKHAEKSGADAISATPPLFFSYSEDDIYNYYKMLASSVNIPLMVYYNPAAKIPYGCRFCQKTF